MVRQVTRVRVIRTSSTTAGSILGGLLLLMGAILIPISMANDPTPEKQAAAETAVAIDVTVVREIDDYTIEVRRPDGVTGRVRDRDQRARAGPRREAGLDFGAEQIAAGATREYT